MLLYSLHVFSDGRVERFEACEPIDPRFGKRGFTSSSAAGAGMDLEGWIDCKD